MAIYYRQVVKSNIVVKGDLSVMCPMFEIASNPMIDLREMEAYRMKMCGILVVDVGVGVE